MKGVILGLKTETSEVIILGDDDKRYHLQRAEWKSAGEPKVGMEIDFVTSSDDLAKQAYCIPSNVENQGGAPFAVKAHGIVKRFKRLLLGIALALGCLVLVLVGQWLNARKSNVDGKQPGNEDATKSALYNKGFAEGKQAGYLLGIDDARHNQNNSAIIRTTAKHAVNQTKIDLKGQGRPAPSEDESEGIVDGYVQGYADGQRKVFVDGQ